jgi:glycosyltransferase involved in cell wall biosynthesis
MEQPPDHPRISKEPISMLLPVYNQAAGLETIAESWLRAFAGLDRTFEVVIVDDGSTDETPASLAKLASRHPEVRVHRHDARRGYGAALRTGLAAAIHPLVFCTACDYPYPPADIAKLLAVIDEADLVSDPVPVRLQRCDALHRLIARVVFGVAPEPRPGWRGWGPWRQALRFRFLFGLRLWDPMSAYKLFRRSVLDRIPIQSNGDFVHAELLAKANFLGCLMAEVPIGRLAGNFKGVPEPALADGSGDARRVFRRPVFAEAQKKDGAGS